MAVGPERSSPLSGYVKVVNGVTIPLTEGKLVEQTPPPFDPMDGLGGDGSLLAQTPGTKPAKARKPTKAEIRAAIKDEDLETFPDWLDDWLDDEILKREKYWDDYRPSFRGSGLGDECARALTFGLMGHRVPFPPRTLRIFRTGSMIEDVNVELFKAGGRFLDAQTVLMVEDPPIEGHPDIIFRGWWGPVKGTPETEEKLVCEVKSIKEELWEKLPTPSVDADLNLANLLRTHAGYIKQWNFYANVLEMDGCLFFESKNTQRRKIFWLRRDKGLYEGGLALRRQAWKYGKDQRLAPLERDTNTDKLCIDCRHRYLCKRVSAGSPTRDEVIKVDRSVRGTEP